ncbi:alpha/beta hydrolase [Labrys monachus]|uniref:Enterochelin esterase family protein n=1 Tax=Labrys monachus TaxID=217067 RepID=A0ABU0F7E3_9HYPH|nr:alpha/beta hydrolase family protein [Labrys monachus]MDQ0390534.1 enterochelin esterase family protein [Labrys monachus]
MNWPVSMNLSLRWRFLGGFLAMAAFLAGTACAPASTLEEMSVPSQALGHALTVSVYRPADPAPKAGWPVLYLLHGLDGSNRDWSDLGGIQGTLDRLIKGGRIHPMVVVMPDAGNSWYVDSADVKGPGNYETAILNDLPKAIEKRFAPHCERRSRAIAGISMGGFGALRFALKRPDRYVAVASLSGAIWQNVPVDLAAGGASWTGAASPYFQRVDPETVIGGVDLPPDGAHFGGAFGTPFDARRFNAANVFTLLARQLKAGAELPAIYLTVGDSDSHNLWRGSFALYETLMADRQKVEFRVTDGDHVWSLWRRTIEDALVFVDSKFGTPAPAPAIAALPDKPRKGPDAPGTSKVASGEAIVK